MRSGASGGNNVLDTINAAASAIASSDDRLLQSSPIHKRKWWNRWSLLKCFRSSRQRNRIGNSVLVPEPVSISSNSTSNSGYRSVITTLPFIAPPSSPASFFQSEPTSATQSPVGILSFSPLPCNNNRPSIFAIGPYAHEPQLVSPPVFSTYTTEPSSAPITPPLLDDSSIYLTTTTPSSPEVPFAQLFNSNHQDCRNKFPMSSSSYEFQFYQLPPGSPLVGQLISPSSVVSGSGPTSPFPDGETSLFPHFQVSDPPMLLSPGRLHYPKKTVTKEQKFVRPHKPVSFDLDADHVIRCVDQKLRTTFPEASSSDPEAMNHSSLGSNKEFDFGTDEKHMTVDEHRASPKNSNDWSFFPVMQSVTRYKGNTKNRNSIKAFII
ncbi:PREDICTED: uncharacterized protein At1g76660-like isoform X2 [Camelina sativa]|uniref:Uncharacterized protein At1g76660-like isoform X2 n=1 Tax=Camelina sativa TaxID=90675 RepID=A0ABM0TS93_CAMSA|nr:PREDICTED: uncharacterized protein At1g76660-like isoform X2 [Camelina sativa]